MIESIAAKESGIEIKALLSDQRKHVYISLYQCHLPKMGLAGIVDFEKSRGGITFLDTARQLDRYLDGNIVGIGADDGQSASLATSSKQNLAITAGMATTVSGGLLGVPGLEQIPTAGQAVLSTATLMAVTTVESYEDRPDL